MATDVPDSRSFKSWEDAFRYPLATTRQLEKQLRSDATGNKERLRSLVGASYRDLLDTAERISQIDHRMQDAEFQFTQIGVNCNSELVEGKLKEAQTSHSDKINQGHSRWSYSGQLMLLQKCKAAISRLFKIKGSVLLAAKLLTISRLLHKTLSQNEVVAELLESFRKQIAFLRRKLLRRIDRQFESMKVPTERLIEAICAFCLATSSSSTDAVKHFQYIRFEAIKHLLNGGIGNPENIDEAVRLFVETLRTSQALFGRRVSDAFKSLRGQPLVQDAALMNLDELALDTYGTCIPVEVQNFIPWVKFAEVSKAEALSLCKDWSQNASEGLMLGLSSQLRAIESIDEIISIRKRVLCIWLGSWSSIPSHDPADILEKLRRCFNGRIRSILEAQSNQLADVTAQLERSLLRPNLGLESMSLWDSEFTSSALTDGASGFRQELIRRHLGLAGDDLALAEHLDSWVTRTQQSRESISQIKSVKWSAIIEDEQDDESDIEGHGSDDDTRGSKLTVRGIEKVLQTSDMDVLSGAHTESLQAAFASMQKHIVQLSRSLTDSSDGEVTDLFAAKSCLLLRTIRTISQRLSSSPTQFDLRDARSIITEHHKILANYVVKRSLRSLPKHRKKTALRYLWEPIVPHDFGDAGESVTNGTPLPSNGAQERVLPTIPDPTIFRFLRTLVQEMCTLGPDIWTRSAILTLKEITWCNLLAKDLDHLSRLIPVKMNPITGYKEQPSTEAHKQNLSGDDGNQSGLGTDGRPRARSDPPDADDERDKSENVQVIFDYLYLQQALGPSSVAKTHSSFSLDHLKQKSGVAPSEIKILEQRSKDYWNRSGLLFGPLMQR